MRVSACLHCVYKLIATACMKPPIFPPASGGTDAQLYLHRARQFREAAIRLPDSRNGEQNWPKYALVTHAIELALKGFVFHLAATKTIPNEPKQHDLVGWYEAAVRFGLGNDAAIAKNIGFLNELHRTHFMRYPVQSAGPVPNPEVIADHTVDQLLFAITQVVNPR
jgi:hypothetical protein